MIIGHPARTPSTVATREQVDDAIRIYNAHLSRIQVLTYADATIAIRRRMNRKDPEGRGAAWLAGYDATSPDALVPLPDVPPRAAPSDAAPGA